MYAIDALPYLGNVGQADGKRSIVRGHYLFIAFASLFIPPCASIGPDKLVSSHMAYNDAVQLTVTREVLANIVRSRYSDPMQFIAVSSINAQFSVNVSGSPGLASAPRRSLSPTWMP